MKLHLIRGEFFPFVALDFDPRPVTAVTHEKVSRSVSESRRVGNVPGQHRLEHVPDIGVVLVNAGGVSHLPSHSTRSRAVSSFIFFSMSARPLGPMLS